MSAQPFGFNVHLRYIKDIGAFYKRMDSLRPASLTIMIDKDEHIPHVLDLAARYQNTLIVARPYHEMDASFHLRPENDPLDRYWVASPADFIARWGVLGKGKNLSLYTMNEPLLKEDTPSERIERFNEWWRLTLPLARKEGVCLTGPNFGMGLPGLNAALSEWDERLDPFLRLLSQHRDHVYLGLHEYDPESQPFHMGRLMFMLARCKTMGIEPPRILLTEFGTDATTSPKNGYRARGWGGDLYLRKLTPAIRNIYMPLVEQGLLVGWHLFSYGNSGNWAAFDVETDQVFFDTLATIIASGSLKPTRPIPVVTVPDKPTQEAPVVKPNPTPQPPPQSIGEGEQSPARIKRTITITAETTDEEWAQIGVVAVSALDALSKLAGLGEPIKTLLSRIVISDLSEGATAS